MPLSHEMSFFTPLSSATALEQVGGKARNLARAQRHGFQVPQAYVLQCKALEHALQANGLEQQVNDYLRCFDHQQNHELTERHRGLCEALLRAGLPGKVKAELTEVVAQLVKHHRGGLAVRSSATYEDSESASFAGVFESWLDVHDVQQCERRILECWGATWAPRALRYLKRMKLEPRLSAMAVILQRVINPVCSGVIYTADPDTGNPWRFIVRATPGLAVDLLSGSGTGDSFLVDYDTGSVVERIITPKTKSLTATDSGLQSVRLDEAERDQPALSDQRIKSLTQLARELDETFSQRLDIEFAFTESELWLVQARPLTALPPFFPHELADDDQQRTWQLAPYIVPLRTDLPPGMITPLYADLSDAELWSRHQPKDIVLGVFCTEERDIQGYRYFLAEPPPMFAHFFEKPSDYETWLDEHGPSFQDRWDRYPDELAKISSDASNAIHETTSAAELIPQMLRIRDRDQDLNSFAWSGPQWLGWMCDMLLSDFVKRFDAHCETGPLIAGGMDSYTFRATRALQTLGRRIHEPMVRTTFESTPLDQILTELRSQQSDSEFLSELDTFCWQFGKTPLSWIDRPSFWNTGSDATTMMHTVRCAMRGVSKEVEAAQSESRLKRDEAEQQLRHNIMEQSPHDLTRLEKILDWARYWGQALNDRHELTVGMLWERELIWHVGQRMCDEGALQREEEVLLLYRDDLERYADCGLDDAFRQLVPQRRKQMHERMRLSAPPSIGAVTAAESAAVAPTATDSRESQKGDFTGQGIGASEAVGLVRHVPDLADPSLLDSLGSDDILVLPHAQAFHYADWHSILTLVAAVISPGEPSHHLAQVARECCVPVIGHVTGDLTTIKNRARLRVDAKSGVVQLLD